jgi:hypothetical protein
MNVEPPTLKGRTNTSWGLYFDIVVKFGEKADIASGTAE